MRGKAWVLVVSIATAAPLSAAEAQTPDPNDDRTRAATDDIWTVISAEGNYQGRNDGYYDTIRCLGRPAACIQHRGGPRPEALEPELASLATRGGYRRRFDAGGRAPARNIGPGKASRSSIISYAYWVIPDSPEPGRRARCGDGSGMICEMPDAIAPPTKGECPVQHGCQRLP